MSYGDQSIGSSVNSLTGLQMNKNGLTVIGAAVFIIGQLAGSGILALPSAIKQAGWSGIGMLTFCALISAHASVLLAKCWLMVEEKWPEYRENTRNPFPTIGEKAVAPYMKYVCSFLMDSQLYGVCVVFLILGSTLIKDLWNSYFPQHPVSLCTMILLIGLILIPISFAGSPEDFPAVAYGAMLCTLMSSILIIFILIGEAPSKIKYAQYGSTSITEFALSFGVILFVYGGTCTFPTIQNDMINKKKFPTAVYLGFISMLLLYLPIAIAGYAIYGEDAKINILDNMDAGNVRTVINFLMAVHLFCAYLICVNPFNLDIENAINIKHSFNIKRCFFRTCVNLSIIFVALTVPKFDKILALVGAFSVSSVAYVLTPWFFINLSKMEINGSKKREISLLEYVYLIFLILIGLVGGLISTFSAAKDIIDTNSIEKPCYMDWLKKP